MNIVELISSIRGAYRPELFIGSGGDLIPKESLDIYFEGEIGPYSMLHFFNAEEMPGLLEMEVNGIRLINLFPFEMLMEMVNEIRLSNRKVSDEEIADRVIDYRLRDA